MLKLLKKLPIDLGQKEMRYKTKASWMGIEAAGLGAGQKALDLGCANGFWSDRLKERGWQVTSMDKDTDYPGALHFDLNRDLPFGDNNFDFVLATAVIAYMDSPEHFLKEIRRVLKPNGKFVITTPNLEFWPNYLLKLFGRSLKQAADQDQVSYFNYSSIRQLFPKSEIYGYFPYMFCKMKIKRLVGLLSPVFIIIGSKQCA